MILYNKEIFSTKIIIIIITAANKETASAVSVQANENN